MGGPPPGSIIVVGLVSGVDGIVMKVSTKSSPLWVVFAAALLVSNGHSQSVTDPPATIPNNCSLLAIASIDAQPGTAAYVMLRHQIAALAAGHEAEERANGAVRQLRAEGGTPTVVLTDFFLGMQVAKNKYLCGAYIAGQLHAINGNEQTAREMTISVYNRLAIIQQRITDVTAAQLKDALNGRTTDAIATAQDIARLTNQRNQAFDDLDTSTTMMAMLAVYVGDPTAKVTDTLHMTSGERIRLMRATNRVLGDGHPDGFTQAAGLLKTFFSTHRKTHE